MTSIATLLLLDAESSNPLCFANIGLKHSALTPVCQTTNRLLSSPNVSNHPAVTCAAICRLPVGFGYGRDCKSQADNEAVQSSERETIRWLTVAGRGHDGGALSTCTMHVAKQNSYRAQILQPLHVKRRSPLVLPWPRGYVTVIGGDDGGAGTIEYARAINSQSQICAHWSVSPSTFLGEQLAHREKGGYRPLILNAARVLLFGHENYEVTYTQQDRELSFAFEPLGQSRAPRWDTGVCQVGRLVFVVGGTNGRGPRHSIEIYDLDSKCWVLSPIRLKTPRANPGIYSSGQFLIVLGGRANGKAVQSTEIFSLSQFFATGLETAVAQLVESQYSLRLPKTGRLVVKAWAQWRQRCGRGPRMVQDIPGFWGLNLWSGETWTLKARSFCLPLQYRTAALVAVSVALPGGALAATWCPGMVSDSLDLGPSTSEGPHSKLHLVSPLTSDYFDDEWSDYSVADDAQYSARCDAVARSNHAQLRALTLVQVVLPLVQRFELDKRSAHQTKPWSGLMPSGCPSVDTLTATTTLPSLEVVDTAESVESSGQAFPSESRPNFHSLSRLQDDDEEPPEPEGGQTGSYKDPMDWFETVDLAE